MAFSFDGVDDRVEFAVAPLSGYTAGPWTAAMLFKLSTLATGDYGPMIMDSGLSNFRLALAVQGDKTIRLERNGVGSGNTSILVDSTKWYLAAVTWTGATSAPRVHLHDGTAWAHGNAPSTLSSDYTILGTDKILFGSPYSGSAFSGTAVCAGLKKANSSDAAIEALSPTSFQTWRTFAFDWLVGFDSSLISGGLVQDQATPGTGDEVTRTGTSAVADPPGWAWIPTGPPVANFTGTPLTGGVPLSVAFTDSSTNTPTSWAWNFGDGTTSTSQNPSHSYTTSGTYTVTLVATNPSGSDTKTRTAYITASEAIVYAAGGGIEIY
jgi:hypothetical protein